MASIAERPLFTQLLILGASLLCGFGLWLVVQLTETEEVTLNINVVATRVAPEVKLELRPTQLPVKFSFPAIESGKMRPDNFFVEVDFSDIKDRLGKKLEETGDRTLSKEMVQDRISAAKLNITTVDLLSPQVSWDARFRFIKAVVEPTITGTPAEGYVLNANSAVDEGGKELLVLLTAEKEEELKRAGVTALTLKTMAIDITGESGTVRRIAPLDLPAGVSLFPDSKDEINRTIFIDIAEETASRTLEGVALEYQFLTSGDRLRAIITPATVNVVVRGRVSIVNKLTPEMLSFGLFGVVERAGETREVAVDARITDPEIRVENIVIATEPRTVVVSVEENRGEPAPVEPQPLTSPDDDPTTR